MLSTTGQPQRGLSLIELAITIAILAITLMFGLPAFMDWTQNTQLRTVAESVHSGLQLARAEAVRRNTRIEFKLSDNAGTAGVTGWTVRFANTGVAIQSKPDGESSGNVTITPSPAGADTVTFDGTGRLPSGTTTNANGSAFVTQMDIDSAALSATNSRDLRIIIGSGGQIRMCDPNVSGTGDPRKC